MGYNTWDLWLYQGWPPKAMRQSVVREGTTQVRDLGSEKPKGRDHCQGLEQKALLPQVSNLLQVWRA